LEARGGTFLFLRKTGDFRTGAGGFRRV